MQQININEKTEYMYIPKKFNHFSYEELLDEGLYFLRLFETEKALLAPRLGAQLHRRVDTPLGLHGHIITATTKKKRPPTASAPRPLPARR